MNPITIGEIIAATGGTLVGGSADGPAARIVCTDTRALEAGCAFVALSGENFDGHKFVGEAAAKGAVVAVVERVVEQGMIRGAPLPLVSVASTRVALGQIAAAVRRRLTGRVIGVAGSNGKTGTKHLIDSALCGQLRGSISPKSFNNDIGVPLGIFPADPADDYLVLEMGTNHPGEIRVLTRMARPDIAVITNCSAEHLEFLGDLAGVRRENASVIEGLSPTGVLVVHGDNVELLKEVAAFPGKIVRFGVERVNDLWAGDIRLSAEGVRFKLNGSREVSIPLLGRHTAINALAAIAVAREMGLSDEQIVASLAVAHGPEMRLELETVGGVSILNDAYNANPASMKAALETLASVDGKRHIAVLGDMRELGATSDGYHKELGRFAATCPLDALVCVGEKAKLLADAASAAGLGNVRHYADARAARDEVAGLVNEADVVLFKGSRAMRLEEIAKAVAERQRDPARKVAS